VYEEEPVLQAFKLMRKKRVGAIPIVDISGIKVVGNISIRDVQFLLTAPEIYHDYRFVAPLFPSTVVSFIVHYQNVLCFVVQILKEPCNMLGHIGFIRILVIIISWYSESIWKLMKLSFMKINSQKSFFCRIYLVGLKQFIYFFLFAESYVGESMNVFGSCALRSKKQFIIL
jgi:hypothetical protein